jgi:SAM-dependent methyltransferase
MSAHAPDADYSYYRGSVYWNDFPQVTEHLNRLVTGDPARGWIDCLKERFGSADCVLSLNCGNGWVDRDLFRAGVARSIIGIDIQESSLATARAEADRIGMPARYIAMDTNRPKLMGVRPQWALNHAALHHATYIDRLVGEVYLSLPVDGLLISYDYIGPHRNQYHRDAWLRMEAVAADVPEEFRPKLAYPHFRTILATDPTEAVHSELVVATIERYFDVEIAVPLGGEIAYQLLFENDRLYAAHQTKRGDAVIRSIIEEDIAHTRGEICRSLFAFIVARKRRGTIKDADLLRWSSEEDIRELVALRKGSRYYWPTSLELEYYGPPEAAT